jgi:hypothetical protein
MKDFWLKRRCADISLLSLIATPLLTACVSSPPPRMVERQVVVAQPAPPAPLAEPILVPPAPDAYWVQGNWRWNGYQYVWIAGRWVQARPGEVLAPAHWENDGVRWVYHPEYWAPVQASTQIVEIDASIAPPPPRVEIVTVAPSPHHFWIGGYWRWTGGGHVWQPGHWEARRAGYVYSPAHWVRAGSHYRFIGGYWRR